MERITITIDDSLLRKIDDTVDGHYVKNRSHAVDLLLKKALSGTVTRQAVILAGGSNERLSLPSGKSIKPLFEVGGKPVIEHIIGHLRKYGIEEVVICLGMLGEGIVAKLQA
ncbi:MAG: NTP transferase domain-containing protein, partial [Candidatus Omnitrophica bacterium]|nr:NTP transferase domain-containing protein [Candidatus Omnitrophota bacterium]